MTQSPSEPTLQDALTQTPDTQPPVDDRAASPFLDARSLP